MNRWWQAGRRVLVALVTILLALAVLSGCGSGGPSASRTSAPLLNKPGAWPLALPVTPKPGEPFVGYWRYLVDSKWPSFFEVLKEPDGYQVSWNGQVPYSVPLVGGPLVLQTPIHTSTAFRPGYELAWEDGRCVFYTQGMGPLLLRQVLPRLTEIAYVTAVTGVADETTKRSCNLIATNLRIWTSERGQGPPSPADMHPGSPFDQWMQKLMGQSVSMWPYNPFTGKPMRISDQRGDFSYLVDGTTWTMRGNLSDGGTFNAKPWEVPVP